MKQFNFLKGSRFLKNAAPALLLICAPLAAHAAAIAGLDGIADSSTFSNHGVTSLSAAGLLGWTNVTGEARFFDLGGDGALISDSLAYGNYRVQYSPSTPVAYVPNTQYSLTINMGYVAGNAGGLSEYNFSLGSLSGNTYTALQSAAGAIPYTGNMHSPDTGVTPVTLVFTTGAVAPAGTLALQWAQTFSTEALNSSDFFGFNKVTLDASAVPEPSIGLIAAAGLAAVAGRRKRSSPTLS